MGPDTPVEYAVAVDRYLGQTALAEASRRVYRISLLGWAWPLVGKPIPSGADRRGTPPPVVPLALLDDAATGERLATAMGARAAATDPRTVNRELSALRGAIGWWQEQGWVGTDPTEGLRHRSPEALAKPLTAGQVSQVLGLPASLREHAFWRLLHDSGAPAAALLSLNADQLDLSRHRARPHGDDHAAVGVAWQEPTTRVLRWLLAGRTWGPVFVTDRRAKPHVKAADVCRGTGQARMSYRRAAEIFTGATRPLDPAGRGWTLHQLSAAGRPG